MTQRNLTPVRVIGAGWGRTGTSSLHTALNSLGFHCYGMENAVSLGDSNFWSEMSDDKPCNIQRVVAGRGCDAAVGFPSSIFFMDFVEQYPDAKVILTIRDEEEWYESMMHTWMTINIDSPACSVFSTTAMAMGYPSPGLANMVQKLLTKRCFRGDLSKESMIRHYREHNNNVKRLVPREQLLVIDFSKGSDTGNWTTLSNFLCVSRNPHLTSFPSVNNRAEFRSKWAGPFECMGMSVGLLGLGIPIALAPMILPQTPPPPPSMTRAASSMHNGTAGAGGGASSSSSSSSGNSGSGGSPRPGVHAAPSGFGVSMAAGQGNRAVPPISSFGSGTSSGTRPGVAQMPSQLHTMKKA